MRGWIVAGLVVLAVSSVGMQSGDPALDDMSHASDAVSRAERARLREARVLAGASSQLAPQDIAVADAVDGVTADALPTLP